LDVEYKVAQDALKYQFNTSQNELVLKTNEDMLHEAYKWKSRELRAYLQTWD
jgi:hypothetical protein